MGYPRAYQKALQITHQPMLKFWHSNKLHFLYKENLKKYLLYALGEILLIIIGILVALQINNWSNKRNDFQSKISLLHDLKEDLQMDIDWNKTEDSLINAYIPRYDTAFKILYTAKTLEEITSITSYISIRPNDLSINNETYQEMINTGKFYLIKNKMLKKTISNYYKRAERAKFYIQTIFEKNYEVGYDINLVPFNRIYFGTAALDTSWIVKPNSMAFLAVERMIDFQINELLTTRKRQHKELLELGQVLIKLIEKEIQ